MIEAEKLTRRFGSAVAVDEVSLRVPAGTVLALLGPNGAGKTTTVRMLAGLLAPSAGDATVAGCDVRRDRAAVRSRVGLVTDVPGLYEQMTAPAYLDFFGGIYGMPAPTRRARIDDLLSFFELESHRQARMTGYSRGMKQKVALARALLHEPAVLFLDEPTSGLDPLAARAVRDLVVSLTSARRTIVLCTHDLDEAERLADQIAIMRKGRIVALDAPANLRAISGGAARVTVDLASPCPAAHAALADIPGVVEVRTRESTQEDVAVVIEYGTIEPATVNPLVLARLIGLGARVIQVRVAARSLEDVYAEALSTPGEVRVEQRA